MEHLKNMPLDQRQEFIKNHADVVEEGQYFKAFSQEELSATQSEFSLKSIQVLNKEDELKSISDQFKAEIKLLKTEQRELLNNIQFNGQNIEGKQYGFANQENGTLDYYDEFGGFIRSRRLRPDERQKTIFQITRSGTNG
jgi:hypothetical protein